MPVVVGGVKCATSMIDVVGVRFLFLPGSIMYHSHVKCRVTPATATTFLVAVISHPLGSPPTVAAERIPEIHRTTGNFEHAAAE